MTTCFWSTAVRRCWLGASAMIESGMPFRPANVLHIVLDPGDFVIDRPLEDSDRNARRNEDCMAFANHADLMNRKIGDAGFRA